MAAQGDIISNLLDKHTLLDNEKNTWHGAQTPQYIIKCADFFSSDLEGFEDDGAPCFGIRHGASRLITYNSSGQLSGDGKILTSDTMVCMKYGDWGPIIYQYMVEGRTLELLNIWRFISVEGTKKCIQELNYKQCQIKTYKQYLIGEDMEYIVFSFGYVWVEDACIVYDHTGKNTGKVATSFSIGTLKVESK
ncbi:MAG: hypothetical protein LBT90_03885 [Holosporaceae bacterium]|jgi:hypothetical protein|nr:hypothetical protein [Holosporaceae bacterium]